MTDKPIRILQIVSSLNQGNGVFTVIKNWHNCIDRSKIQFDYLYFIQTPTSNQDEIKILGGRTYKLPNPSEQPIKFLKESYRFFYKNRYRTIHSHLTNLNLFFYPIAKLFGTKNIIQHAHGTKWSDKKINGWCNYLMLHAVWPLITYKIACSQVAGKVYVRKNYFKLVFKKEVSLYRKCMLLAGCINPWLLSKLDVIRRKRIVARSVGE